MKVATEYINEIEDLGFRNRFVTEFHRITGWTENLCDLQNANIYDFGCGGGVAALSFALTCPDAMVYGTDIKNNISKTLKDHAQKQLGINDLPSNLTLQTLSSGNVLDEKNTINLIYSWSVFEHIRRDQILDILIKLKKDTLVEGGLFYLQINPLYFSSRGAHLYTHVAEPWCHLLHQHDVLKELVFSSDKNRQAYDWEQYETLNRITVDELLVFFEKAGFKLIREQRIKTEIEPPEQLTAIYNKDVLITDEVMALFRA